MQALIFRFWPTCVVLLLCGCVQMAPFRTSTSHTVDGSQDCTPQLSGKSSGQVAIACESSMLEVSLSPAYKLHFVEFDDQGLQYPEASEFTGGGVVGDARQQINDLITRLDKAPSSKPISILVFVHGWKNNAHYQNENVVSFRRVLASAAESEAQRGVEGRQVIGVYVSWRGMSASLEPFKELSFWDRKFTAEKVAVGSVRALFARLKGFQCARNNISVSNSNQCSGHRLAESPNVRMLLIGHSFGALVLYNAISESLIESLTYSRSPAGNPQPVTRFGDMVVLLNPAFEATRYTPLFRAAQRATSEGYNQYQAPIFVSITSSADWATGLAFPLGRSLSTTFEQNASIEEKFANLHTIGHMELYRTHNLVGMSADPCLGWISEPVTRDDRALDVKLEIQNSTRFFKENGGGSVVKLERGWKRGFCGAMELTSDAASDPNSPIWNIVSDGTVMSGHNDITNPRLEAFIRQLYRDVTAYADRF